MADKLMVVAHPDDESIFGGASLLKESGWKVVCVTNLSNRLRFHEFVHAMEHVDAEFEIWDYEDNWGGDFPRKELAKDLRRVLKEKEYDMIVTHNRQGEYGHTQHIALSEIMHQLVDKNLWVFGIREKQISNHLLQKKRRLLSFYPSQRVSIESLHQYVQHEKFYRVK